MIDQLTLACVPEHDAPGCRDSWQTPDSLYRPLHHEFGFIIDLAASARNAKCDRFFTAEDNALVQEWPRIDEGWCWLNPPFTLIEQFCARVVEQRLRGSGVVVCAPGHRHEQDWFHRYVIGHADECRVPHGRVAYASTDGVVQSGPSFPSMVLVYWPVWRRRQTIMRSL